jgi:hypothetical protein
MIKVKYTSHVNINETLVSTAFLFIIYIKTVSKND